MRAMVALFCTLASGIGFFLSLGAGSAWWLAWLAPIPVLWYAFQGASRGMVMATCIASVALGLSNLLPAYWGSLPNPVLAIAILGPGIGLGGVALASQRAAQRLSPLAGALLFAALWTAIDYLLSLGPDGTAASWANSQAGAPVVIQSASVFGIWAIDFVLMFFASGIAISLATGAPVPAVAATLLFMLNAAFGVYRLELGERPAPVIHVGLAASDSRAFLRGDYGAALAALDAYSLAAAQLAADRPSLIVFPEKIAALDRRSRMLAQARLQRLSQSTGATIVMGLDDESSWPPHNSAFVAQPNGHIGVYDKRHMVPGLEDKYALGRGGFVLPDGTGVAICKDLDFPSTIRRDAQRYHPNLLAVPAWDFDRDGWWHARLAILRGVENGFAVARSAKNGVLTLSDAYGRVWLAEGSSWRRMALRSGTVPRGPGGTLYTAIGDVFAWFCLALSAALLSWTMVPRRRTDA